MAKSIRPYLENQADRVEAVLMAHRAPGRITGGTVGPRLIRFFFQPAPHVRYSQVAALRDDLALALKTQNLDIARGKEGVVLTFGNPNPRPVMLPELLADEKALPLSTALLGLTDDGAPLFARLSAPEVSHVLVAGTTGSGKSVLLRAIAASLVLGHTPGLLRLICIDPKGRTFGAFKNVAHLTRDPITRIDEAVEALRSLLRVLEARDARREQPGRGVPRLVVVIDELADLIMQNSGVVDVIVRLVQRGREAGIHVVAATQHPSAAILGSLMRANFPLRLVGKVTCAEDARIASGRAGTNAHLLDGRGDFLAISGGDAPTRFQVAYIGESDLKRLLDPFTGEYISGGPPITERMAELKPVEHLPVLSETPTDRVQQAVETLRPQWPHLRGAWLNGDWGIKTKIVRIAFGDAYRYEGSFAEWIEAAVAILENATATVGKMPVATAEAGKKHIATGSSSNLKNSFKEIGYA